MIRKIGKIFNKFEENALMISLAVMVIVIFMQVVMRYIFNNSLSWSEEFARYLFVWFSWMGVSAGLKDGEHLKVELLSMSLLKRGLIKSNEIVAIIVSLIWLATTLIVTYYGFEVVAAQMDMNVLTPAMRLPVWIAYLSIPACSGVVGIRLIAKIADSVMVLLGKSNSGSEVAK
ncbi:MAG TPA: TRAP transporter small permease [Anaerovoracaceae bacterium]|nr:TRAP transporter small permease [Anaerovoracaceae bacterium]